MQKSFILHLDSLEILDKLTNEQRGELLTAMVKFNKDEDFEMSPMVDLVFFNFKKQFLRDREKYEKICEKNRKNGEGGGRPKKDNPENPVGLEETQDNPGNLDSDSKNDSDSKKEKNIKKEKFQVPDLSEIKEYFTDNGSDELEAEKFFNFYKSNGWKVGKNKMKNWHGAAGGWMARNRKEFEPDVYLEAKCKAAEAGREPWTDRLKKYKAMALKFNQYPQ